MDMIFVTKHSELDGIMGYFDIIVIPRHSEFDSSYSDNKVLCKHRSKYFANMRHEGPHQNNRKLEVFDRKSAEILSHSIFLFLI